VYQLILPTDSSLPPLFTQVRIQRILGSTAQPRPYAAGLLM
jgi:hypothetical protein